MSFIFSTRLVSFEVRLELQCCAWLKGLTLPPSVLPRLVLRPICLASSFLSCLTSSALPRFHSTVHPPFPLSIPAGRANGFNFKSSIRCPLVSYTSVSTAASKKLKSVISGEPIFTRVKYQMVETIRTFYQIVHGSHRSFTTVLSPSFSGHNPANFVFQLPTKVHI